MLDTQLMIFKCVAEKKSISVAAQELYMSQSAISQQIQSLESYYGVKLFDRMHHRIVITQAGKELYPYAVQLERLYQEADKALHGLMEVISGRLDMGASLTIGEYLLPERLVAFRRLFPRVSLSMTVENTEKIIARVADGSLDVGFLEGLYRPVATLRDTECGGDQLVIIASPSYELAGEGLYSLKELIRERWLLREPTSGTRRVFEQFVRKNGFNVSGLNIVMELSSTEAIKSAVKAGDGLGVMSCLAVAGEVNRNELKILPLQQGAIERCFTMIIHREKFQTLATEKFIEFIKAELQNT